MTGVRDVRAWWHRVRHGVDQGDLAPGQERSRNLRGRALRDAVRRGEVDPDGATRTIRQPEDPDR